MVLPPALEVAVEPWKIGVTIFREREGERTGRYIVIVYYTMSGVVLVPGIFNLLSGARIFSKVEQNQPILRMMIKNGNAKGGMTIQPFLLPLRDTLEPTNTTIFKNHRDLSWP